VTPSERARLAGIYHSDGMAASTPQKLVVLMFERIGLDLERAIAAIDANRVEAAHRALLNAQDIVFELQLALDVEVWPEGAELASIYHYLLGMLVDANLRKSADVVRQCRDIVTPLSESWGEAYLRIQRGQAAPAAAAVTVTS
jgi:flagellar protein FliS